jgi:hemolysin III
MGLKEPFNSISHMVGGGLSIVGAIVLLLLADRPMEYVAAGVYGFGLISLYAMSSIYHGIVGGHHGSWLERLDHVAIYLLIAGTYTPLCLLVLPADLGFILLAVVSAISIAGIVLALTLPMGPVWLHPLGYIVLGWGAVFFGPVLMDNLPPGAFLWLLAGGIIYTAGSAFYVVDKPLGFTHTHHLWHLAVIAGSIAHYVMVAVYLL